MPDDCICIGFEFFETQVGNTTVNIANDAAVLAITDQLDNEIAAAARAGRLETAKGAVHEAALRKAGLDRDGPNDLDGNFDEGSDFDFG